MVEQLQMDKETLNQQCHDLQQELLLEGDKQQELQEQIKRLKDEMKNRLVSVPRFLNDLNLTMRYVVLKL